MSHCANPNHNEPVKLCRGCESCPKCEGFKIQRGDYCPRCVIQMLNRGYVWSSYYSDYVKPGDVNRDVLERERKHVAPIQGELFARQRVLL